MSVDIWVTQVGQVLSRAHSLFADPVASGAASANGSSTTLAGAAHQVRLNNVAVSGLSGEVATRYTNFAAFAGLGLDGLARTDVGIGTQLDAAAATDRDGRRVSGNVLNAAASDTSTIGPAAGTPAGEQALIKALRDRVAQQQHVVQAWQVRDARMAALLRQMMYSRSAMGSSPASGGGMPQMGSGSGRGLSLPSFPNTSSLFSGLSGDNPRTSGVDNPSRGNPGAARLARLNLSDIQFQKTMTPSGRESALRYINAALDARGVTNAQARANWTQGYLTLMQREATMNPNSVNLWDSNARGAAAADGHPFSCSRGWTQMTPAAFAEAHQAGTSTNIYDPVANIAASMNRMQMTYHVQADGSDLRSSVQQTDPNRPARGY